MIEPRWSKIGRDLLAHKLRTLLTVLSIGVGVFAILVVIGGRGMLVESFDSNFPRSIPANATRQPNIAPSAVPAGMPIDIAAGMPSIATAIARPRSDGSTSRLA